MQRMRFLVTVLVTVAALLAVARSAHAAIYMQFEGISGESKDQSHTGWIDVQNFSFAVMSPRDPQSGQVKDTQITVTKTVDVASPKLMQASNSGKHFKSITLDIVNANAQGVPQEVYRVVLTDVLISRFVQNPAVGNSQPTESVTFNFTKMEVTYGKTDARGVAAKLDPNVRPGWDAPYRPRVTRLPPEVRQVQ